MELGLLFFDTVMSRMSDPIHPVDGECRGSICRLRVATTEPRALQDFMTLWQGGERLGYLVRERTVRDGTLSPVVVDLFVRDSAIQGHVRRGGFY